MGSSPDSVEQGPYRRAAASGSLSGAGAADDRARRATRAHSGSLKAARSGTNHADSSDIDGRTRRTTMLIRDLMITDVQTCHSYESLNAAAQKMWDADIGAVVVV